MELRDYFNIFKTQISEYNLIPENSFVFILNSGGKDSTAMSFLLREYARKRSDLELEYFNVVFPQMVFGNNKDEINKKVRHIEKYFKPFESIIAQRSYEELEKADKPCFVCKEVRREIIAEVIDNKKKDNIIIATGHNNYDLLAYFIELFGIGDKELIEKGINYDKLRNITISDAQLEHFSRFFPKLEIDSGITLIKPMLVFNRLEINDILKKAGILAIPCNCPYASERPKRNLFKLLRNVPKEKVWSLVSHDTFKEMLSVLKEKAENFDESLEKVKQMDYSELLL